MQKAQAIAVNRNDTELPTSAVQEQYLVLVAAGDLGDRVRLYYNCRTIRLLNMTSHSLRQNCTPQYRLRRKSPEVKPDNLAALHIYYNTIPYTATQELIQIS